MKAQCTLRAKGSFPAISSGHTHKQEQVFEQSAKRSVDFCHSVCLYVE